MRKHFRALMCSLVAVACAGGMPVRASAQSDKLVVHVFDIGQGSCVLVECPDDLPILIDCGKMRSGGGSIESAATKIDAVLDRYDVAKPLRVLLSHGDVDHYSLLSARTSKGKYVLPPERVHSVYFGGAFQDYGGARAWINAVHRELSYPKRDYPVSRPCNLDRRISCLLPNEYSFGQIRKVRCGRASIDLLTANAQAYYKGNAVEFAGLRWKSDGNKNADSAVVRISYEGASFIFTGDAQQMTEELALRNAAAAGVSLQGTSFMFGSHHGAKSHDSNSPRWIDATSPRALIFSSNLGGNHGHPACEVIKRFDEAVYGDRATMDRIPGGVQVRCDKRPEPDSFRGRFFVTEATGDIRITVSASATSIWCQRPSPACQRS